MKNNIERKRKVRGLTQSALGELLGVSRQTIISIERGRYNPSLALAFQIARVFGCTIEDIFVYDEEEEST